MKTLEAHKHKQRGFTIIELVIVILVIGILSAVALPRMIDLSTQARKSVILAVTGNLSTSVELLRSQWIAEGKNPTVTNFDKQTFYIGPSSENDGRGAVRSTTNALVAFSGAECTNLWNALLRNPPKAMFNTTCLIERTCKFEVKEVGTDTCRYEDRDGNYITYNTVTGAVENGAGTGSLEGQAS